MQTDDNLCVCVCVCVFVCMHAAHTQVTEVKGLGSLLVGMVTCASADFFLVSPQLMVVDVTELGTVKLQLEVLWKYEHTD